MISLIRLQSGTILAHKMNKAENHSNDTIIVAAEMGRDKRYAPLVLLLTNIQRPNQMDGDDKTTSAQRALL